MQECENNDKIRASVTQLVIDRISGIFGEDHKKEKTDELYNALHLLLNGSFVKYDFNNCLANELLETNLSSDEFQILLSKINEKGERRKAKGVYYTPKDVTRYILANVFMNTADGKNDKLHAESSALDEIANTTTLVYEKTIFDPTCGAGEFLINAFEMKCEIARRTKELADEDYIAIIKTIYGNDVESSSIEISQIRLFFEIVKHIENHKNYIRVAKILKENFSEIDFVMTEMQGQSTHDIIVGNPPYVEYGKLEQRPQSDYGNIFADVLKNSIDRLSVGGTLGFIVPLSYVSTLRMRGIRAYIKDNTTSQFILSFADRPDCLFTGVHQKLCIVIAVKGGDPHRLYTTSYKHWYKTERIGLLNGCEMRLNKYQESEFIPKIENAIEESIYKKIFTNTAKNLFPAKNIGNGMSLYLNMRGTFWIKAFTFNPGSKEYKKFDYDPQLRDFVLCVLNSSLFFVFWTMVSDCWHITGKELKHFKLPDCKIGSRFNTIGTELESKLEKTKKYIGTIQTEYEYKHKECKDIIDRIDDELAIIYELTEGEINYVKNFALKYRVGGGA